MSISSVKKAALAIATTAALAFTLSGCATTAAPEAAPDELQTITAGKLTIGTGLPAYEPWVVGDAPENAEGFEAAVAYAVAAELGFAPEDVVWVRTTFDEAIAPGAKNFDFNLQQYSITPERQEAVDFSSPYYSTAQTVITVAGSKAAEATSLADLKGLLIGAATGTTSFSAIETVIAPTAGAQAFNSNDDAKAALANGQVDAIVVDLPTAFYIAAVELTGASVVGQFPVSASTTPDNFGFVFDLDNPLVSCVDIALAALKDNGTLAEIEKTWLSDKTNAPVIAVS
jgi:polar amino acid transport system substrate-binding protein